MNDKSDLYTRVTDKIIADLEKGTLPWLKPWGTEHHAGPITRPLRATGIPYKGINVVMLWATATEKGYACPLWMTYKQAQEHGAQVRKGEKGAMVVYADVITRTETGDTGEEVEKRIPFLKSYTVFNAGQIDGLPAHLTVTPAPATHEPKERNALAEAFISATGATIRHGGNQAYYSPSENRVQMPELAAFVNVESYYATLAHELTHWTRHPSRLDRSFAQKRFGDAGYAMEELVAEMGAAFLCADLGITPETREDHAAYIAHWLTVLRQDKRAIFTAASHAQRAADHLHSYQSQP